MASSIEQLDEASAAFFDIGTDLAGWTPVLAALAEPLGSVGCDLHLIRDNSPLASFMGGTPPEVLNEYTERFINNEPRSMFLRQARVGTVATDLEFVSPDVMATSDYYADFLRRAGMGHCIAGLPLRSRRNTAYFGIHMDPAAGPPSARQMALATHLMPQLNRALTSQFHLIDAQLKNALYSEAFDNLDIGLAILGERKNVLVENRLAASIFRAGTTLSVRGGKLIAVVSRDTGVLDALIATAMSRQGRSAGAAIVVGNAEHGISVSVTPASRAFRAQTGAAVFVFLVPLTRKRNIDRSGALMDLFGLTLAEARIASLLAQGHSTRELAAELGITYETARTTIKQIFAKTGVRRQAQLVALVHSALPPLAVPGTAGDA